MVTSSAAEPAAVGGRGVAAGLLLSLFADACLLLPVAAPHSRSGGVASHLVDRGFLGGYSRPAAQACPLGGSASLPPGSGGLRGFASGGVGPRADSASGGVGDALGGNTRLAFAAELSAPPPLAAIASAGIRASASLQVGIFIGAMHVLTLRSAL